MKCKVEGCDSSIDFNWGALGYHLRAVHAFGDRQMHEYQVAHFEDYRAELAKENERDELTEVMNVRIVFLPDEATREGLIHVLSEASGAIVEMGEIKK